LTIKDWEEDLDTRSYTELYDYNEALETLQGWDVFKREYSGHGLNHLRIIVKNKLDNYSST
jgi:hypothetical protein